MSIRVHRVKQLGGGSLEIMIWGGHADAQYVSGRLKMRKGVTISEAKQKDGMDGFLYLVARGTQANPFTRERALEMLRSDQHIEVVDASADDGGNNGGEEHE